MAQAAKLYMVGSNQYGQIGNGTSGAPNNALTPVEVVGFETGVTAAAVGGAHALAVKGGASYGWGLAAYGMLGNGTTGTTSFPTPQPGLLTSGVTTVRAGQYYSMFLVGDGLYAAGLNLSNAMGTGDTAANGTPTAVAGMGSGVTSFGLGARHTIVVQNGAVYAWGFNGYGAVGNGASGSGTPDVTTPYQVPGLSSGATMVSAGSNHNLALVNGSLWAWGDNQKGQLGSNSTYGPVPSALIGTPQAVLGLPTGTITDISAGGATAWHS
ncbi:MAG: hypothetical protein QM770_20630 [Tepidisphaeraceae bacterium]